MAATAAGAEQGHTIVTRSMTTLEALLTHGNEILGRREREAAEARAYEAKVRQESWDGLRRAVARLCPELGSSAPPAPPEDFTGNLRKFYSVELRLWDAASLFVTMECEGFDYWRLCSQHDPFRVSTAFRAKKEDGRWAPVPDSWRETDSLAEALALCQRASFGPYRDCAEKCKALAAEEFKAKAAPLPPTALERLGIALHDYVAECVEGQE